MSSKLFSVSTKMHLAKFPWRETFQEFVMLQPQKGNQVSSEREIQRQDDHRERGVPRRLWRIWVAGKKFLDFIPCGDGTAQTCERWWLNFQKYGELIFKQSSLKVKLVNNNQMNHTGNKGNQYSKLTTSSVILL